MNELFEILSIQKKVYDYMMFDYDLENLFYIKNIGKIVRKYFPKDFYLKIGNNYLFNENGIILLSFIINTKRSIELGKTIINTIEYMKIYKIKCLDKIKIVF